MSALTPRLRAIQWPPNFKVSNVDKYEPKQDPGGWLAVYTTAARAAGASEDVMTAYLPIVLDNAQFSINLSPITDGGSPFFRSLKSRCIVPLEQRFGLSHRKRLQSA